MTKLPQVVLYLYLTDMDSGFAMYNMPWVSLRLGYNNSSWRLEKTGKRVDGSLGLEDIIIVSLLAYLD